MKKIIKKFSIGIVAICVTSATALAYSGDVSLNSSPLSFSTSQFLEGRTVRIYATSVNNSSRDLLGVVRFYANDQQINGDQPVSLFGGKTDDVFLDWTPYSYGEYKISAEYIPWENENDDPNNNWVSTTVYVAPDTDYDGIQNSEDPDDDNDGVSDSEDAYPLNSNEQYDTDGDGIGDNADEDDDNDGVPDEHDDLPLDPNETTDTDGDGQGDIADEDDDNDGLSDLDEDKIGTDSLIQDTDEDGVNDGTDDFPLDPNEWLDTDGDQIGNNTDLDDDNDGMPDDNDDYPLNKGPVIELENTAQIVGLLELHSFDASPSYDEDGEIISYIWKIDNELKDGPSIEHSFDKIGDYEVELTVTDNTGESRTSKFMVSVINLQLYLQLMATLIVILLALLLYLKYISRAKNQETK